MIYVTGYGQMCNNMLQYGHFYAFGRKNGIKTIAMRFCYKYHFFKINKSKGHNWLNYIFAKYGVKIGLLKRFNFESELDLNEDKINALRKSKLAFADGWYFRDYDGFLDYREELKQLFSFQPKITKKVTRFMARLPQAEIKVGLHIRRGDYIRWHDGKFFFSDEEYCNIIKSFLSNTEETNVQFFIATNDNAVNEQYFEKAVNKKVFILKGNPAEDLCLLSNCDYIIGPPSTFTLMASFYNDRPLYWIFDPKKPLKPSSFKKFEQEFQNII